MDGVNCSMGKISMLFDSCAAAWRFASRLLCGNFVRIDCLQGFVANQSIALVGNACSLVDASLGSEIDSHDLVIRFNHAPIPDPISHGTRTDLLATSLPVSLGLVRDKDIRHVMWMSPRRHKMKLRTLLIKSLALFPLSEYRRLEQKIGARPSTGLMMIEFLKNSQCRNVDIYGFDFFASLSLSGNQTLDTTPHQFASESEYVFILARSDKRFKLCR